jgi:hypothetical protein
MKEETKGFFDITIDNGIALILAGILVPFLVKIAIWIVPVALIVFGIFQIVRGYANEGIPNIGIAALIWVLGHFFRNFINWIGGVVIVIGIVVLIVAIVQRKKRKK